MIDGPIPSAEVLAPTLRVINQLEAEGLIIGYAIGGSIALMHYTEAFYTDDLDIFCHVPSAGLIITGLAPVYNRLGELGFYAGGEGVRIHGVKVQFLLPPSDLCEESMETAVEEMVEGVQTRVFDFEHVMALKAEVGRHKDWGHLGIAMESGAPNMDRLKDILTRYNLLSNWVKHELPID